MNTLFPIIYSLIIFLFPFVGKFHYNRQTLNSIVISLGLLGTFIGIIYSLLVFDFYRNRGAYLLHFFRRRGLNGRIVKNEI